MMIHDDDTMINTSVRGIVGWSVGVAGSRLYLPVNFYQYEFALLLHPSVVGSR